MTNTEGTQTKPVARRSAPDTAGAMCPKCGRRALVKGRYDDAEGDSRAWAYCTKCPYNYDD